MIAATAAGAGLYMIARTIGINRKALAETQRANRVSDEREREAQVTDRYTKAIEQLGDDKLDVRLGGIYALERIAHDSKRITPLSSRCYEPLSPSTALSAPFPAAPSG